MRVAVIGSGISGLVAAHHLARRHDVVLYESESRLGGHTHTVDVPAAGHLVPIDTGFIVFNRTTYPNFVQWLESLGVASQPSDMSFSVRSDRRDFEYGSAGLNAVFAQRRHLLSPRFHRLWRDILRFYRDSRELLETGTDIGIGDYLGARGYSEAFVSDHLLPLIGAVWSSSRAGAADFPARLLVRFFDQHGFLRRGPGLEWRTVTGGSRQYIRAILSVFTGDVRLSTPVERLTRNADGVELETSRDAPQQYDHVVLACHADQALALWTNPTAQEQDLLGAFRFQENAAVLHTDARLMPRLRRTWASWNYHLDDEAGAGACVTYWMNRLQSLAGPTEYLLTLNRSAAIRPECVVRSFTYTHPIFTPRTSAIQARHDELVDHQRASYCGAYWRNGFHEDGMVSALRVTSRLGVTP